MRLYGAYLLIAGIVFISPAYAANPDFNLPLSSDSLSSLTITTNPGWGTHKDSANRWAYDLIGSTSILSVGEGTVRCASYSCDPSGLGGLCVIINHPSIGLDSEYCHLASASVSAGDPVSKGMPIGIMGNTGSASEGVHLHFSFLTPGTLVSRDSAGVLDFSNLYGYNPNPDSSGGGSSATIKPVGNINLGPIAELVKNFYTYSLAIGGILALLIIVYGGVMYIISPASASMKDEGKKWITAAVWGLALLILSYLILVTINPCLVGQGQCPG